MRYCVGIPTFGEHGHGNHAANRLAQTPSLAYGVHNLAQNGRVAEFIAATDLLGEFAATLQHLLFEDRQLWSCDLMEVVVQFLTGFQLHAVN